MKPRLTSSTGICRLDGSMTSAERMDQTLRFQGEAGVTAFLMTLGAGAVGLNLQAASCVILAEPAWTPSAEEQAMARAHRWGQSRQVTAHKLYVEGVDF